MHARGCVTKLLSHELVSASKVACAGMTACGCTITVALAHHAAAISCLLVASGCTFASMQRIGAPELVSVTPFYLWQASDMRGSAGCAPVQMHRRPCACASGLQATAWAASWRPATLLHPSLRGACGTGLTQARSCFSQICYVLPRIRWWSRSVQHAKGKLGLAMTKIVPAEHMAWRR